MENIQEDRQAMFVDLLQKFASPSPAFRMWTVNLFQKGKLDLFIDAAIKAGKAGSEQQALEWLAEKISSLSLKDPLTTSSDLWGGSRERLLLARLSKAIQKDKQNEAPLDLARFHGMIGHMAIPELLSGRLDNIAIAKPAEQLFLLNKETVSQWENVFPVNLSRDQAELFKEIRRLWRSLSPLANGNFEKRVSLRAEKINRFYSTLSQIFGSYTEKIKRDGGEGAFLYFLTMMSWVAAVRYYQKEKKQILFQEMLAIDKRWQVGAGRVDALTFNDRLLTKKQKEVLAEIALQRYNARLRKKTTHPKIKDANNNLPDFLHYIRHQLGRGEIEPIVIELKLAVGDGFSKVVLEPNGQKRRQYHLISYDEVKEAPLKHHLWQVKRYLVFASLGYHFTLGEQGIKTRWPDDVYFPKGKIIYFLPTQELPVVHDIAITPEDQQSFFGEVAQRWSPAQRRRIVRHLNNEVVKDLMAALDGKTNHKPTNHKAQKNHNGANHQPVSQLSLISLEKNSASPIAKMVEERREFFDDYRIIEIAGKKEQQDEPVYRMHLDAFLAALKERKIVNQSFSLERGEGFVRCFLPGHNDATASFHVNLRAGGIFKCFGQCGIGGKILATSIPDHIAIPINLTNWGNPQTYSHTISYKQPDDQHIKIMKIAEELLQASFRGSPGEEYLVKERCLDSDLAFSKGVGFAGEGFIGNLLDAGFTLKDLIRYGFVGFSNRFDRFGDISDLLKRRGISPLEDREKQGFPCSALHYRITFPLTLLGKINNFYGRVIVKSDRSFFHRKLTQKYTGVEHGGFNMEVLEDANIQEVFPVEGCCDVLAFIQMCQNPAAIGIIGTENWIIIEELARSDKKIGSALDYDDGGKKRTYGYEILTKGGRRRWIPGLLESLERRGKAKQDLRDFTKEFVESRPDIQEIIEKSLEENPEKPKADWNDWHIALCRKYLVPTKSA